MGRSRSRSPSHRRRDKDRSERRKKRRSREREKERAELSHRSRHHDSRDRDYERSRSRERVDRSGRRSRSRSRSHSHHRSSHRYGSPSRSSRSERPQISEADLEGKTAEEIDMMKTMGFCSFDTTKNKKVDGNDVGEVHVILKRKYRQYMNRKGGFNRPLDFVA